MSSLLDSTTPTVRSADGTLIWATHAGRSSSEAPTIVFVPGFACSSMMYIRQFEDRKLLESYSLITYEPRGQSRSDQPEDKDAYSSLKNAQDFKAVLETFGAKRVTFVGWSYGGLIPADVFANLGSEWINGVIYISAIPWRSMFDQVINPAAFGKMMAAMAPTATIEQLIEAIGDFINCCFHPDNLPDVPHWFWAAQVGIVSQQRGAAKLLMMTERHQDESKLLEHKDKLPVKAIIGENDIDIVPQKLGDFVKSHFPLGEVTYIKEAGHAAFWEKSEEVNAEIRKFTDAL